MSTLEVWSVYLAFIVNLHKKPEYTELGKVSFINQCHWSQGLHDFEIWVSFKFPLSHCRLFYWVSWVKIHLFDLFLNFWLPPPNTFNPSMGILIFLCKVQITIISWHCVCVSVCSFDIRTYRYIYSRSISLLCLNYLNSSENNSLVLSLITKHFFSHYLKDF